MSVCVSVWLERSLDGNSAPPIDRTDFNSPICPVYQNVTALAITDPVLLKENLKTLSHKGLPIYAECGGLIFLGKSILLEDQEFTMSGILPIKFGFSNRPQGHGYTKVEVINENPFFKKGEVLRGHNISSFFISLSESGCGPLDGILPNRIKNAVK